MGTACYTYRFRLSAKADEWLLSLGDVRESARVRINGQEVATLWALPYSCLVGRYLKPGENVLEVEVTNLPANRIAEMDRRQVPGASSRTSTSPPSTTRRAPTPTGSRWRADSSVPSA